MGRDRCDKIKIPPKVVNYKNTHMKFLYLIMLTVAAFISAAAISTALQNTDTKKVAELMAEKKRFSLRCSPLYNPAEGENIPLLTGWGNYGWKITTSSDSAQLFFNQGINMYYAFHIIEARASFERATKLDPDCAMAWWGKALAFGPNINDFGYEAPSEAFPSAKKAIELKGNSTPVEKALIEAMAIRYTEDRTADQGNLNILYKEEMRKVLSAFNKDENVSVLYADALMLLHPWDLYDHDFQPKPWTPEIVSALNYSLSLNPEQPGANHYLIHAVEGSATPQDAMKNANFLASAMPNVSHLTHMPSHIYIRTGYYAEGIDVNNKAVKGYYNYLQKFPATEESSMLYELHNVHMKLNCAQMAGNYSAALEASIDLQNKIPGFYLSLPGALGNYIQYIHQSLTFTNIRFGKWDEILKERVTDSLAFSPVLQHFARGIAFARKNNLSASKAELELMKANINEPSLKEPLTPMNSTYDAAIIGRNILEGIVAENQKDNEAAIKAFEKAVVAEDNLIYNEPRDWLLPARQYLGNALINAGRYQDAVAVFQKDLEINPNNGWSLTGMVTCYQQLKNRSALQAAQKQLKAAWKIKDCEIVASVF
jgi:tetratricopeptide (TPR) repeat protein